MKRFDCVIADDEKLARDVLQNYISRIESLRLVASCQDTMEIYNFQLRNNIDLIFLDIKMPQLNGMNFVKSMQNPPKIIFTTAYQEYAVQAFELNAVDYLIKPFSFERFLQAVEKAFSQSAVQESSPSAFIELHVDRKTLKVPIQDIVYIEAVGNYVKVHLQGKAIITYKSMQNMITLLPSYKFKQVHRSYIVAMDKVTLFSAARLHINTIQLPIGRRYRDELRRLNT